PDRRRPAVPAGAAAGPDARRRAPRAHRSLPQPRRRLAATAAAVAGHGARLRGSRPRSEVRLKAETTGNHARSLRAPRQSRRDGENYQARPRRAPRTCVMAAANGPGPPRPRGAELELHARLGGKLEVVRVYR